MKLTTLFPSNCVTLWQVAWKSSLLYFNTGHNNKYWNWLLLLFLHIIPSCAIIGEIGLWKINLWLHYLEVFNHRTILHSIHDHFFKIISYPHPGTFQSLCSLLLSNLFRLSKRSLCRPFRAIDHSSGSSAHFLGGLVESRLESMKRQGRLND